MQKKRLAKAKVTTIWRAAMRRLTAGWLPACAAKIATVWAWSEAELAEFLKTGRNDKSVVFGGMSDVVEHSLQYLSDDDITAIARYLKSLRRAAANRPQRRWKTAWRKICGRAMTASPARRCTWITARPATVPMA
jgi:hypothetical protein